MRRMLQVGLWFGAFCAIAWTLTGCAARAGGGETAAGRAGSMVVDLPSLVVDYDSGGQPTTGGVPLRDLGGMLPQAAIVQTVLPSETVQMLAAAGIQHVQFSNTPSGVRIHVNGEPLPTFVWDDTSLANLIALVDQIGAGGVVDLLPLTTNVGIGLALRMPVTTGVTPIPLRPIPDDTAQTVTDYLDTAGSTPVIHIPVKYESDGTWTVQGITDTEWQALTGLPFGALRLNADFVQNALKYGIRTATLQTDANGIHLAINDQPLPYLAWSGQGLVHLLGLLQDLQVLGDPSLDLDGVAALLSQWLPAMQSSELRIDVTFPDAL
ncbi:MAG: hypothetical protein IPK16_24050 [Anaerolineales bacterium]|nr:hypothetical protein [Anaerolineales bacterium]